MNSAIKQPGLERLFWVWLVGMAAGKPSSEKPGVSSVRPDVLGGGSQALACVEVMAGCALFLGTVQFPLERHN